MTEIRRGTGTETETEMACREKEIEAEEEQEEEEAGRETSASETLRTPLGQTLATAEQNLGGGIEQVMAGTAGMPGTEMGTSGGMTEAEKTETGTEEEETTETDGERTGAETTETEIEDETRETDGETTEEGRTGAERTGAERTGSGSRMCTEEQASGRTGAAEVDPELLLLSPRSRDCSSRCSGQLVHPLLDQTCRSQHRQGPPCPPTSQQ